MRPTSRVRITIIAGLAALAASVSSASAAEQPEYRLNSVGASLSTTQAGAHPDFLTVLEMNGAGAALEPHSTRDITIELPAGLLANATAIPMCSLQKFVNTDVEEKSNAAGCPQDSQVGITHIGLYERSGLVADYLEPVYNLQPNYGEPVRLGFIALKYPVLIDTELQPDYSVTAKVRGASAEAVLVHSFTTLWGDPASEAHDSERLTPYEAVHDNGQIETSTGTRKSGLTPVPYMLNPTNCDSPLSVRMAALSYAFPEDQSEGIASLGSLAGCSLLSFEPAMQVQPTAVDASTGSGLDVNLTMPQEALEHSNLLAQAELKRTQVTLPEGVTLNPSEAAGGLGVCTEAQYAAETASSGPAEGCPQSSKIGTVTAKTPLLNETAEGSLYLGQPHANPFKSLVAIYAVLKIPDRGVVVKLPGDVEPNPVTGQLVTTFDQTPQLPTSSFHLHFREGARAPLVTPPACGSYASSVTFDSWAGQAVTIHPSFDISGGVNGGSCPPGGLPPFAPSMVAGMQSNNAGSYSPLYMRIARSDGEQEITGLSAQLPPGLTGKLTGIPFCSEADIARARQQSGAEAESAPACPASSQIGRTVAEAGVGSVLAQTPGWLYLAGPFEGAPFSVVDITSAKVGPFDLGTVVVHLPLRIDPHSAQVSIPAGPADQIPHIIDGIMVHLRAIRIYIDRRDFTINPTSCAPLSLNATVYGAGQDFTSADDDVPSTVSDRFQTADCANLGFSPALEASTARKASRKNGASLHVKLNYPKDAFGKDANVAKVKVELPKQLPSRLSTLQQACTDSTFDSNPAACPAASRVGTATAITPILPVPLTGPAYFVSHGGKQFPELIVVLQGYGMTVDLAGETFISKAGITSSTFATVPDVPAEGFELSLPQGANSALAANGDLCAAKLRMPTVFTGQNGAVVRRSTPISVTGCKPAIRVLSKSAKGSKAKIVVQVPFAGRLQARGRGVSSVSEAVRKAGRATVALSLSRHERQLLGKHPGRRLKVRVHLVLTPVHGGRIAHAVTVLMG